VEMKFCYRCGARIQPGSRFCMECGAVLVQTPVEKQPTPAEAPVVPAPAPEVKPEPVAEEQKTVMYVKPAAEQKPAEEPVAEIQVPAAVSEEMPAAEEEKDSNATIYVAPADVSAAEEPVSAPVQEPVRKAAPADPDATVFVAADVPAAVSQPVQVQQPVAAPQPVPVQQRPVQTPFPQHTSAPQPQRTPVPQAPASRKPSDAQKATAAKTKSVNSKKYGPMGGGLKFLAVLLCILLFFASSAAVTVLSARLSIRPENIADTAQGLIASVEISEIEATEFFPEAEEGVSVSEWIVEEMEASFDGEVEIDTKAVEEYLENSVLLHSVGEYVGYFVEDILTGSYHAAPDRDEICDILVEDQELMEELFGFSMEEEEIQMFAEEIEESGIFEDLDAELVREEAPIAFDVIELTFSYEVIGGACLLVLILCVLVGLVNRGNMIRTFRDLGVTETVLGGLMTATVASAYLLTDYLVSMAEIEALKDMVRYAVLKSGIPAVSVLGVGIVMLIVSGILKAAHKKAAAGKAKAV